MTASDSNFEIRYQPKIDLKRKCLAGAEALVRLEPSTGEFVHVLQQALLTILQDWESFAEAGFNLHLTVELPGDALALASLASLVQLNKPQSKHWPGLIFEIAEDRIVRDIAQTKKIAAELKACGVAISVADFGAGFSSFASLRDLPFAEIKIDASFVKNCATDVNNAAICQTAIDLAHRFGSRAVAEGIGSMPDLQALVVMGCDLGQGAMIGPPMPKELFLDLLRTRLNKPRAPAPAAAEGAGCVA